MESEELTIHDTKAIVLGIQALLRRCDGKVADIVQPQDFEEYPNEFKYESFDAEFAYAINKLIFNIDAINLSNIASLNISAWCYRILTSNGVYVIDDLKQCINELIDMQPTRLLTVLNSTKFFSKNNIMYHNIYNMRKTINEFDIAVVMAFFTIAETTVQFGNFIRPKDFKFKIVHAIVNMHEETTVFNGINNVYDIHASIQILDNDDNQICVGSVVCELSVMKDYPTVVSLMNTTINIQDTNVIEIFHGLDYMTLLLQVLNKSNALSLSSFIGDRLYGLQCVLRHMCDPEKFIIK